MSSAHKSNLPRALGARFAARVRAWPLRIALASISSLSFAAELGCSSSVNALSRNSSGTDGGASGGDAGVTRPNPVCQAPPNAPPGVEPLPTPLQLAYQRTELTAFLHFGLGTFDGTEYGDASKDVPSLFNPTQLDANAWANTLKSAGFHQATLVAKHSTGFCLWPSAYTDYSVKNSSWQNGEGDVVREFTDAMHAAGLRVGLYLSPWDQHYPSSSSDYEAYFRNQLSELLTHYGDVDELEFDGFHAPTSLDWAAIIRLAKSLQPNVQVWMGPEIATTGADLRWIGNQAGQASRSTSSIADVPNGGPSNTWYPAEAPVSDRDGSWFWHPNNSVKSLSDLQTIYFKTVGMNTTLIFNVPPATTGQFDAPDLKLLRDFGSWYWSTFDANLLKGQTVTADSTWQSPGFEAANAIDDDVCSYWAADRDATTARLEVTFAAPQRLHVLSIREALELGEICQEYHIELKQSGAWNRAPTDASGAEIRGTVIGQRQLWTLGTTTAEAVALVIDSARGVPAISEFSAY